MKNTEDDKVVAKINYLVSLICLFCRKVWWGEPCRGQMSGLLNGVFLMTVFYSVAISLAMNSSLL